VILDIEGTTTPISFVAETLFPYIRHHLDNYLRENWSTVTVQEDVQLLRELSNVLPITPYIP
jgi:methionine salvage enolase-phosphatase E1